MAKRALITGITGQDGSYLAELLLEKGYEVYGTARRLSAPNHWRIEHLLDRVTLLPADLLDQLSLLKVRPVECATFDHMEPAPQPAEKAAHCVGIQWAFLKPTFICALLVRTWARRI